MEFVIWIYLFISNDILQDTENFPKVTIAVAISKATPFMEEFFDSILALDYPREKLDMFIYNNVSINLIGLMNTHQINVSIM